MKTQKFSNCIIWALFMYIASIFSSRCMAQTSQYIDEVYNEGDFKLVFNSVAADICIDRNDHKVVTIAANNLIKDIERVTKIKPRLKHKVDNLSSHNVLIGTLGKNKEINKLVNEGKLNVTGIKGKWETFLIQVISEPRPDTGKTLIIVGSDRRGTAYGIYDLSEKIGVSPWYWWADVPVRHRKTLIVRAGRYRQEPPSVKYRGIFINDERWGLRPWAVKTFCPERKGMGPEVYAKIFELLLRLKANYLWPGAGQYHFNYYPENKVVADDYAIVIGTSHCEPLLTSIAEWRHTGQPWNYQTNKKNIYNYWENRIKENGTYENTYTLGMRGLGDASLVSDANTKDKIKLLEQIIEDQRTILKERVNPDITKVPQMFCPYKEVLSLYEAGLKIPNDVTIVWAEDNHGYIRRLPTPQERKRSGGFGIYYHVSAFSKPHDYLWLCSTPPALICEEMSKAYEYNCREIWVLNVGDIKPAELDTEFFLKLGWNVESVNNVSIRDYIVCWARREFGSEYACQIADIMQEYYRLGYARKPEHMGWNTVYCEPTDSEYSLINYGDEAQKRIDEYEKIVNKADAIYKKLPKDAKDAFYQLVLYPVRCSSLMTQKFLYASKNKLYAFQGRASANDYAQKSRMAFERIQEQTSYYNNEMTNGKWRHMMSWKPREINVFKMPALLTVSPSKKARLGIVLEGKHKPLTTGEQKIPDEHIAIDIDAVNGLLTEPMKKMEKDGVRYVVVPNGFGNVYDANKGGRAVYKFTTPTDENYCVYFNINCLGPPNDSWFIKINDGPYTLWNGNSTDGKWKWKEFKNYRLCEGTHTLTVNQREDGSLLSKIRITTNPSFITDLQGLEYEKIADLGPKDLLPTFSVYTKQKHFIDIFNYGLTPFEWKALPHQDWIELSQNNGRIEKEKRIWVKINFSKVPCGQDVEGAITISGAGSSEVVRLKVFNPTQPHPDKIKGFVESDGYVSMEAENYTNRIDRSGAGWRIIEGLGRTGDSVAVLPTTTPSVPVNQIKSHSPTLEYSMYIFNPGNVEVTTYCIPTHRIHPGRGLRYAIAIDDEKPQIVDYYAEEWSETWNKNVLRAAALNTTQHHICGTGSHTLKICMVDPGVVIDKIVLDTGRLRPSYLGPPETTVRKVDEGF